jgi:hypothetical protein
LHSIVVIVIRWRIRFSSRYVKILIASYSVTSKSYLYAESVLLTIMLFPLAKGYRHRMTRFRLIRSSVTLANFSLMFSSLGNIKMNLKEMYLRLWAWFSGNSVQWQGLLNGLMKLGFHKGHEVF